MRQTAWIWQGMPVESERYRMGNEIGGAGDHRIFLRCTGIRIFWDETDFFCWRSVLRWYAAHGGSMSAFAFLWPHLASQYRKYSVWDCGIFDICLLLCIWKCWQWTYGQHFFFYIPLYFIAVSGKIYLGMAGKTAAYTDWRNPFCTRLCYMVCVSGIFVWTGIFGWLYFGLS